MSFDSSIDDKERIKQSLSIEEVAGNYMDLRRQGSAFVAICPWHDDTRPSLQINPVKQSWKCWVCDIGGDIFSFVMRRENVQFREAMEILARQAGIELTQRRAQTKSGDPNDKPTLYKAMVWAEQLFHHCLLESPEAESARKYLADRNIDQSAIDAFNIGYAPDSWNWLLDHARKTEFSELVLQAVDLVAKSDRSKGFYDRFRGRVIFPIRDSNDRPIAVGGRILPELAQPTSADSNPPAKYINSRETRLFSKSEQLYALNLMRDSISRSRHMIVVEGYTDVVAGWRAGIDNMVAVLGTALGQRHLRLIRRFADQVTLVLDGDEAGRRRANEVLELFVTADIDLRIMTLPSQADPADFLEQHGVNEFRRLAEQSADAIDHKIHIETEGVDLLRDTHRSHQALESILGTIAASPRQMSSKSQTNLREQQLLARLSRKFQVDVGQLRTRLSDIRRNTRKVAKEDSKSVHLRLTDRDLELIQTILEEPENFPIVFENITESQMLEETARKIFQAMCDCHHAGNLPDFETLMLHIEDPDLKSLLVRLDESAAARAEGSSVEVKAKLEQIFNSFNRSQQRLDQQQAISKLSSEADDDEQDQIMKQLLEQTLQRQGISTPTEGSE